MVGHALLVGSGSVGRRYLDVLRRLDPDVRVTLLRRPGAPPLDPEIAAQVERVVEDQDAAVASRPDLAIVATPASTHLEIAMTLATARIPMLIEKPLSTDPVGSDALHALCEEAGVPVVVGYVLRYHPAYLALAERVASGAIGRPLLLRAEVGQYLPDWRPGQDYRRSVTAQRALGGGALLELSHELDLARALFGMPDRLSADIGRVGDLEIDVEDTVDLVMHQAIGADHDVVATVHLDLLARPARRRFAVSGTDGTLDLDLRTGRLTQAGPDGTVTDIPVAAVTRDDLHAAEVTDLLAAIGGARPRVGLADGIATLRIVEAARRSSETRCAVVLEGAVA